MGRPTLRIYPLRESSWATAPGPLAAKRVSRKCSVRGDHLERTPPDRRDLLHACREGVVAICELAAHFSDWSAPTPCRDWDALDLAGHLRCVAENFHEYLNDAPASRLSRLFAQDAPAALLVRQLSRQNAAELAVLPPATGREHVIAFAVSAEAYADRLPDVWDAPHLSYRGTKLTAGDHAGAVCVEWHLHAWDLARALDKDHRPSRPDVVEAAWRTGVPHLRAPGGGDRWEAVLRASGRIPDWQP
jgi:mycothiol maleylpyruvate isomerase-like protein